MMGSRMALQPGEEAASVSRQMTLQEMILFEPEGERNIHTDDETARAAGLPAAIAAGAQFVSYLFDMLYREYGFQSVPGATLDVRIHAPVFAGDTVTARGRVTGSSEQDGARRVLLDVWCENQRGEKVVAGTAEVTVGGAG